MILSAQERLSQRMQMHRRETTEMREGWRRRRRGRIHAKHS